MEANCFKLESHEAISSSGVDFLPKFHWTWERTVCHTHKICISKKDICFRCEVVAVCQRQNFCIVECHQLHLCHRRWFFSLFYMYQAKSFSHRLPSFALFILVSSFAILVIIHQSKRKRFLLVLERHFLAISVIHR